MIIQRELQAIVERSLKRFPAVGLIGSRQTGKTTLAKSIAAVRPRAVHLDLERPADLAKLSDPEFYLAQHRDALVIIDEVQRRPDLFPLLRVLIDEAPRNGRFLLLGSASPELLKQSSESLAGRIVYHELAPLHVTETARAGLSPHKLWLRGGYPRSLLARTQQDSFEWREAFVATYLGRDLPQLGLRVPAQQMRRFWQMLAHLHGQLWNASTVASSLGVTAPTASHYLAILEDTFLVRRLLPFHPNLGKRLVKRPKVYFRDAGLLHALLRITGSEQLMGHPARGASWEGWVIEQVLGLAPTTWEHFFFRTSAGAEIDLVLVPPGEPPIAVEVKTTLAGGLPRGFREAFSDLGCERGFVVHTGREAFSLSKNVTALPVTDLSQLIAKR